MKDCFIFSLFFSLSSFMSSRCLSSNKKDLRLHSRSIKFYLLATNAIANILGTRNLSTLSNRLSKLFASIAEKKTKKEKPSPRSEWSTPKHYGFEQPRIGMWVLGHLLTHCTLALCCAYLFALPSPVNGSQACGKVDVPAQGCTEP